MYKEHCPPDVQKCTKKTLPEALSSHNILDAESCLLRRRIGVLRGPGGHRHFLFNGQVTCAAIRRTQHNTRSRGLVNNNRTRRRRRRTRAWSPGQPQIRRLKHCRRMRNGNTLRRNMQILGQMHRDAYVKRRASSGTGNRTPYIGRLQRTLPERPQKVRFHRSAGNCGRLHLGVVQISSDLQLWVMRDWFAHHVLLRTHGVRGGTCWFVVVTLSSFRDWGVSMLLHFFSTHVAGWGARSRGRRVRFSAGHVTVAQAIGRDIAYGVR